MRLRITNDPDGSSGGIVVEIEVSGIGEFIEVLEHIKKDVLEQVGLIK